MYKQSNYLLTTILTQDLSVVSQTLTAYYYYTVQMFELFKLEMDC